MSLYFNFLLWIEVGFWIKSTITFRQSSCSISSTWHTSKSHSAIGLLISISFYKLLLKTLYPKAIWTSLWVWKFLTLGIYSNSNSSYWSIKDLAKLKYFNQLGLSHLYSPVSWLITSVESCRIKIFRAFNYRSNSRHAIIVSYSTSLFEHLFVNWYMNFVGQPLEETIINPMPLPLHGKNHQNIIAMCPYQHNFDLSACFFLKRN